MSCGLIIKKGCILVSWERGLRESDCHTFRFGSSSSSLGTPLSRTGSGDSVDVEAAGVGREEEEEARFVVVDSATALIRPASEFLVWFRR